MSEPRSTANDLRDTIDEEELKELEAGKVVPAANDLGFDEFDSEADSFYDHEDISSEFGGGHSGGWH